MVCNDLMMSVPAALQTGVHGWCVANVWRSYQSSSLMSDETVGSNLKCSPIICAIRLEEIVSLLPQMTHGVV